MKKLLLVLFVFTVFAYDKDEECYVCEISNNNTKEYCSNSFTPSEINNLKDDCEMNGGDWRIK